MAGLTFAPFVAFLLCSWIFVLCQGTQELKVTAGEDATLQCRSNSSADITVLRWTRADLKPDDYILFFRDDGSKLLNESYHGRVELRDPEMKDGDASVILKNVTINDTGTYECLIGEKNKARRRKRDAEPKLISTIELKVTGTQELNVTAGEDATLQCQSPRGADIEVIRWTRPDLKPDDYILFFRDESLKVLNEFYRDRVELRDPERKDGDASVILKNVNINDTGTYECRIGEKNKARRRKRDAEPQLINTIKLTVTGHTAGHKEGGDKERNVGLMVGLSVFAVLLVAVVGTMIFKKRRGNTQGKKNTPHTRGEADSLNPPTSG